MPDANADTTQAESSDEAWSSPQLYGGQLYRTGGQAAPRVTQTGSWSDPYFPADQGQSGNALQAAQAIRDYWSSNKGGVYAVDPKTLGMESGIDIGQQIQDSIDQGGYMRGVLDQAIASGRPVPFDSAKWGLKRFKDPSYTLDGGTVGRWGGFAQGALSATPDGQWSVSAGLWPQKTGQYDPTNEDSDNPVDNAAIKLDGLVSGPGTPFWINFNRVYNFKASGKYRR